MHARAVSPICRWCRRAADDIHTEHGCVRKAATAAVAPVACDAVTSILGLKGVPLCDMCAALRDAMADELLSTAVLPLTVAVTFRCGRLCRGPCFARSCLYHVWYMVRENGTHIHLAAA